MSTKSHRFWQDKKRMTYLGGLVALIILIAIGVGIGLALTKDDSTQPPAEPVYKGISATTQLASVNWTSPETDIGTHVWVYFQDNTTNALYQTKWSSYEKKWIASPITTKDSLDGEDQDIMVYPGTTIASAIYARDESAERRIFFLDSNNSIVELSSNTTKDRDGFWVRETNNKALVDTYKTNATSIPPLAAFWSRIYDDENDRGNITVAFVQDNLEVAFCNSYPDWSCSSAQWRNPVPREQSALAIVPVNPLYTNERLTDTNIYINVNKLQEASYWNQEDSDQHPIWTPATALRTIPDPIQGDLSVAAFSYGYDYEADECAQISVIATRPQQGGVSISRWSSSADPKEWQDPVSPEALDGINKNSAIATNQERRLYAITTEHGVSTLVEYEEDDDHEWTKVGKVNTKLD